MYTNVVLLLLLFFVFEAHACSLEIDTTKPGVFLGSFGSRNIFLDPNQSRIDIEIGEIVRGYCDTLFKLENNHNYRQNAITKSEINLSCIQNLIYVDNSIQLNGNARLSCEKVAGYFEHPVENCHLVGVVYGFQVYEIPVIFAEFCFDASTSKILFAHQKPTSRSLILESQVLSNPSLSEYSINKGMALKLDSISNANAKLQEAVRSHLEEYQGTIAFGMRPILFESSSLSPFKNFERDLDIFSSVPFWTGLHRGNWAAYMKLMKERYDDVKEIYSGVSGQLSYPKRSCDTYKNSSISFSGVYGKSTIPFYIWNYVVDSNNKEVVIVGINSPFAKFPESSYESPIFCIDVCDTFEWMKPIANIRRIPALGYIFCCTVEEAKRNLDGFPIILTETDANQNNDEDVDGSAGEEVNVTRIAEFILS